MVRHLSGKTDSERTEILDLVKSGLPYQTIADKYGVSHSTINQFALANGIRRRKPKRNKLTAVQREKLKPLLKHRTKPYNELAKDFQVPRYIIMNYAEKLGYTGDEYDYTDRAIKKRKLEQLLNERDSGSGKSLREISETLGMSYEHIRTIHSKRKKG